MKIYVVTGGDYDYPMNYGATTDFERALEMRKKIAAINHCAAATEIETFEDGVFDNPELENVSPCQYWKVCLYYDKSPTASVSWGQCGQAMTVSKVMVKEPWQKNARGYFGRKCYYVYEVNYIVADCKEKAIQIATEAVEKRFGKAESEED